MKYAKGISPQGRKLYQLLNKVGPMDAKRIAEELKLHQSAIYRLAYCLVDLGLVEQINRRPAIFQALSSQEGRDNYLAYQQEQIGQLLAGVSQKKSKILLENYNFSFIQGREEIFDQVSRDLKEAKEKAHFIVLGLPMGVSPELLLEQRNAVARGVPIKIVIQEFGQENLETLRSWQKQGLELRLGKPIGFHLLLIDRNISYLMYFDQADKTKRYAVRIIHQAINEQMQKVFSDHWRKAKSLKLD